jgi:hypothetical protein
MALFMLCRSAQQVLAGGYQFSRFLFVSARAKYLISLEWQIAIAIIINQSMSIPLRNLISIFSMGLWWDTKLPQNDAWVVYSPRFQKHVPATSRWRAAQQMQRAGPGRVTL